MPWPWRALLGTEPRGFTEVSAFAVRNLDWILAGRSWPRVEWLVLPLQLLLALSLRLSVLSGSLLSGESSLITLILCAILTALSLGTARMRSAIALHYLMPYLRERLGV